MSNKKLCALVVGHKNSSRGAANASTGLTEYDFNNNLAIRIEKRINDAFQRHIFEDTFIQRIYRDTYKNLPSTINYFNPDFVVSLHCNAFNKVASGTEVLYYHGSKKGKMMSDIFVDNLVGFLGLPDRGSKPKTAEDRGGYLLRYTKAPCIIVEPFFIDNDNDLNTARQDMEGLVDVYLNAIQEISQLV